MPIRKDDDGRRWVEMDLLVPGTPEEVWRAMATGPGTTAWFTRTEIEEREGGRILFDLGAHGTSTGEVTLWEPPHRFGYVEREWNPGAPPVATEITIIGRGGECIVRMVHSLFASADDWDDQLEGFEAGWPGFFDVLRIYLAHFAGWKAATVQFLGGAGADPLAAWKRLTSELGLAGADVGERRTMDGEADHLSGVVERVNQDGRQRYVVLRLDAPAPGVALLGTYESEGRVFATLGLYFYGDDAEADAAAARRAWGGWFGERFPREAGGGGRGS